MEQHPIKGPEKIKLAEINSYLTCYLCKGYLIDATTISECLHSFCRSCIIKFLQDNSYCPICEVIINKAKPNLKLDKTLQDIVYKLVPELFLREMTRRKQYYMQYPQIAARVSPEERGEDTERTIFNPQDCISLSMEYVSADSSPGAIRLPGTKNGQDRNDQLSLEENQALMKRYLQCPGMCRVDVLKKFVRNKYNVDTSLFHIDVLYKRVPLPDHYTLIDIAYIYSWKRNEPMKFFFRITDLNKVSERFDYFDSRNVNELLVQVPVRPSRNNGAASNRRKEHIMNKKNSKAAKQQKAEAATNNCCDNLKSEKSEKLGKTEIGSDTVETKSECDTKSEPKTDEQRLNNDKENVKIKTVENNNISENRGDSTEESPTRFILKIKKDPEKNNSLKSDDNSSSFKVSVTSTVDPKDNKKSTSSNVSSKQEISGHLKQNQENEIKNSVYTNITLNRTNNVEIITKIQKVSNKDGQSVGFNIIKHTVKGNDQKQKKKAHGQKYLLKTKPKINLVSKDNIESEVVSKETNDAKNEVSVRDSVNTTNLPVSEHEEKLKFLETFRLTAKSSPDSKEKPQRDESQKRKPVNPASQTSPKKAKLEKKPVTRIILQSKPKPSTKNADKSPTAGLQSLIEHCKIPSSLSITIKDGSENKTAALIPPVKNYIEILKIPDENKPNSDVSKDSTKLNFNFRMNDDSEQKVDEDLVEIAKSLTEKIPMSTTISQIVGPKPEFPIPVKTNVPAKFSIQPSPVPEITNKLLNVPKDNKLNPRSPQSFQKIFEESIKKPDSTCSSPEKVAQQPGADVNNEVTSTSNSKRNILEIASQLYKKTKLGNEKLLPQIDSTTKVVSKVAIPRLPNTKHVKTKSSAFDISDPLKSQQTLANLHSNALGLNYTISVGPNVSPKTNGVVSKKDAEIKPPDIPIKPQIVVEAKPASYMSPRELPISSPKPSPLHRNISPGLGYNSPRNSPKHSPKSSPMIKHMYAPTPNLMVDQLRVNTYSPNLTTPKVNNFSKTSPHLPSSSTSSHSPSISPKAPLVSPKPTSLPQLNTSSLSESTSQVTVPPKSSPKPSSSNQVSQGSPLSPNQILERYNIQNLAQLTASLNFNAANFNAANFGLNQGSQLAAFQHAMFLKHFEMQNRQNWLNMNQGSLLQYEKYLQNLQNLKTSQSHLLSNIKEN